MFAGVPSVVVSHGTQYFRTDTHLYLLPVLCTSKRPVHRLNQLPQDQETRKKVAVAPARQAILCHRLRYLVSYLCKVETSQPCKDTERE